MRDNFVFYRSFFESFTELSQRDRLKLFDALCNYALNDVEPELSGIPAAIFKLLKPQVDANNRKYENGLKGGRPKKNQTETNDKPKKNQTETKTKRNVNDNDNVNENDNGLGFEKPTGFSLAFAQRIIDYLNERVGSSYKVTLSTSDKLKGLVDAGYTEADIMAVIDKKYFEWRDDEKMRSYLRPNTLFGDKFEEYLRAPISVAFEKAQENKAKAEELKKLKEEKTLALADVQSSIEELRQNGTLKEHREELMQLREQEAILEDSIEQIDKRLEAS